MDTPDLLETFDPEGSYTNAQLNELADAFLMRDAKTVDEETGKPRGIKGKDPILFEEHLRSRRRREIYVTAGIPDPSIESGLYNRSHPQGRKVNSEKARREQGASFYRN